MGRLSATARALVMSPPRTRVATSSMLVALSLLSACGHSPQADDDGGRVGSSRIDEVRRDRATLAKLTTLLGAPLPSPADDDDVGIEEPGFEVTRAYAAHPPRLGGSATRMRMTAWRDKVHSVELTFDDRCDAACARSLAQTLEGWAGPLSTHQEGRVRFLSTSADTVQVLLEVYPSRPDLTRVILRCAPLWSASQGRPARLPGFSEPLAHEEKPRCRPLPP